MIKRRTLCVIAAAYAAGIEGGSVALHAGVSFAVIMGVLVVASVGVVGGCVLLRRRKDWGVIGTVAIAGVALVVLLVGAAYSLALLEREDPLAAYATSPFNNASGAEKSAPTIEGQVLKYAKGKGPTVRMTVQSEGRKLLVSVRDKTGRLRPQDCVGRSIRLSGSVELPPGQANPGCFNYRNYLLTQGVRVIIKCDAPAVELGKGGPVGEVMNALSRLKYRMAERLLVHVPKEKAAVITGLMFGMDDDIDEDTLTMFRENGVFHILSVSGMHVAIVYAAVFALFGKRRTLFVCLCSLVLLLCYAALCDFSETVMRAFVMITIHIAAKLLRRRYDFLTGICAAGLALLIINPLSLFNAGFQLSFLAVLLLAFTVPFASRFTGIRHAGTGLPLSEREAQLLGKAHLLRRGRLGDYMIPALCIQFGMIPVTAAMFNIFSPVSLLANLPVGAVSGLLIPLGMVALVAGALPLPEIVFGVMAKSMGLLTDMLTGSVQLAELLPLNHFAVPSPPPLLIAAFYALLFILMSETFRLCVARKHVTGGVALFAAAIIAVSSLAVLPEAKQNRAALTFVDVGQGDCLHIRTPGGRNYLIDGGGVIDYDVGKKVLYEYLMKNGINKIDGVFVTHLHTDHMKGIAELSRLLPVGDVFLSGMYRGRADKFLTTCGSGAGDVTFLSEGDALVLDDAGVTAQVLYPPQPETEQEAAALDLKGEIDENSASLLLKIDYEGVTALMTADLGFEAEERLCAGDSAALLRADILKLGHHGSKYSTSDEFLAAVAPTYGIIQCGRNTFGHPTRETLEKLLANDIIVQRNDLDGAIMFNIKNGRISGYGICGKTEYVTRL